MTLDVAGALPGAPPVPLVSDGTSTLELTRATVVLREVELKRRFERDCADASPSPDDVCASIIIGPSLVELPLDGSIAQVALMDVRPGEYDVIEFDIHKPEDDSDRDRAFLLAHPDFRRVSIRVEGLFDGAPFVFLQDLNEERVVPLAPPLLAGPDEGPTSVTLRLDVMGWFRRADGSLIDPRTANKGGPAENEVRDQIKDGIEAFEDRDRDGWRDNS